MKELIAFLLLWIGAETNYNVNLETPRVVQLTQQELNTMYYTEDTHPSGPTRLLRSKNGYNISKQIFQHTRSFPKRCATARTDSLCARQQ